MHVFQHACCVCVHVLQRVWMYCSVECMDVLQHAVVCLECVAECVSKIHEHGSMREYKRRRKDFFVIFEETE